MDTIRETIIATAQKMGLSSYAVAKITGLDYSTVNRFLTRKTHLNSAHVSTIANALKLELSTMQTTARPPSKNAAKIDAKLIAEFLAGDEIPVDPKLPANWDCCPYAARPLCHRKLWKRPYIVTTSAAQMANGDQAFEAVFRERWPEGVRYDVRSLDGGAWDRSSGLGQFATLDAALEFAKGV